MKTRPWLASLVLALGAALPPGVFAQAQPAPPAQPAAAAPAVVAPGATPAAGPPATLATNPAGVQPATPGPNDSQARRQAVQPGNNAPVWREVRSGEANYTSIKGPETGVLIQQQAKFFGQDVMSTAGEAWRQYRNGPVTFYGGWLVVVAAVAIAIFYLWKGPIRLHEPPTGRMMLRFTAIERWTHWSVAISFSILGISGLVILFGKHILLPVIGYTLFAWLTILMKNLHNFIGPLFIVSIFLMAIIYVRYNFPHARDLKWIAHMGGMFSGKEIPSGRFNAGEKGWFWAGLVLLGTVMSISGLILLFPNFDQLRATMQQANIVHAVGAVIFIAMSFAHIYLGTIGMEGAYDGMRHGYVDEEWAKEHHLLWYEDVKSGRTSTDEPVASPPPRPSAAH
ncbi:MAG: formate dehydrogenase subunit gamma [Betaproteobacteria bacterium]